jgi:hypothetical protein
VNHAFPIATFPSFLIHNFPIVSYNNQQAF